MQTAVAPDPARTDDSPDETHAVCCDDHDQSLCGTIVDWGPSVEFGIETSCAVCADLEANQYCPYTGICRHATKP